MVARERPRGAKGSTGGDAERETDKEGGGGARRFRRASEAWPGKAVRHSGSDGGGSEPITYYNCLASERSERGAPVRHPSSRRMASLPITSAVIANFSRPCLLLASRCRSLLPFTTPNPSFLPSSWSSPPPPSPLLVCINFLAEVTSSERTPAIGAEWKLESDLRLFPRGFLNGKTSVIDVNHTRHECNTFSLYFM